MISCSRLVAGVRHEVLDALKLVGSQTEFVLVSWRCKHGLESESSEPGPCLRPFERQAVVTQNIVVSAKREALFEAVMRCDSLCPLSLHTVVRWNPKTGTKYSLI